MSVHEILDKTTFVEVIEGCEYRLRKFNTMMALRMQGERVFGLIEGAESVERGLASELTAKDTTAIAEGYLREGMVSPRIGDETDEDADVISVRDLGSHAFLLVQAIKNSAPDPGDFGKSSPAPTESQ